jgi:hypothetical protein
MFLRCIQYINAYKEKGVNKILQFYRKALHPKITAPLTMNGDYAQYLNIDS